MSVRTEHSAHTAQLSLQCRSLTLCEWCMRKGMYHHAMENAYYVEYVLLLLLLGCRKYSVWNELCTMWMKYREMPLIKCTPWWKKYRERKEIERYRNEDEKKKPQPMYVHMLNESLYKHRNAAMALQNSLKINHFWDAQITFPFSWKCWLTRL